MRAGRPGLALCLLTLAAGCSQGEQEGAPVGPDLERLGVDQVMVGVDHVMTRDGIRRAHLEADTAFFQEGTSSVRLRRFTVDFFDPQGGIRSRLSALEGTYDMRSGDMLARDSVVVVDPDQSQRLTTGRLTYLEEDNLLRSDVAFVLIRRRDTIRGTGFETDPGLDSLVTLRPEIVSPPENPTGPAEPAGASGVGTEEGGKRTGGTDGF